MYHHAGEARPDGGKLVGDALEPLTYIVAEISLWYQIVSITPLNMIFYVTKWNVAIILSYVT